jgi:diadenosine tetraphosphate (Ap4A) HIT family hydrolase
MLGYVCVVSKQHVIEPFELEGVERPAFCDETLRAAEAVHAVFQPVKINYEIHGNTIPHLHVHVFPRYPGDPFAGGPIDPRRASVEWPLDELNRLREALA